MATGTIAVHGLKELTRDFKKISKDLDKLMVEELQQAADPAKRQAQSYALSRIRNMTSAWSEMRVGISRAQGLVYIVPQTRGRRRSKRPNLAPLLLEKAMWPAVEERSDDVVRGLEKMIDRLGGKYDLD